MALKCIPSARRLATRINIQHDARDFLPVGTFRMGIEHPHVSDHVFMVIGGQHGIGGRGIGDIWNRAAASAWTVSQEVLINRPCLGRRLGS